MRKEILKQMFEIQRKVVPGLQNLSKKEQQVETKEFVLAIADEIFELLREINWKYWRKEKKIVIANINEEIADILKFLLNLCIVWKIDHEKLFNEFKKKSSIVEERFRHIRNKK